VGRSWGLGRALDAGKTHTLRIWDASQGKVPDHAPRKGRVRVVIQDDGFIGHCRRRRLDLFAVPKLKQFSTVGSLPSGLVSTRALPSSDKPRLSRAGFGGKWGEARQLGRLGTRSSLQPGPEGQLLSEAGETRNNMQLCLQANRSSPTSPPAADSSSHGGAIRNHIPTVVGQQQGNIMFPYSHARPARPCNLAAKSLIVCQSEAAHLQPNRQGRARTRRRRHCQRVHAIPSQLTSGNFCPNCSE
jgi:hypothetical protein